MSSVRKNDGSARTSEARAMRPLSDRTLAAEEECSPPGVPDAIVTALTPGKPEIRSAIAAASGARTSTAPIRSDGKSGGPRDGKTEFHEDDQVTRAIADEPRDRWSRAPLQRRGDVPPRQADCGQRAEEQ